MPPNLQKKAHRKRQTRLTFGPVDRSSSPPTISPARVRYELDGARRTPASSRQDAADPFESGDVLSSSKKDNFSSGGRKKNGTLPFKALPTPVKSSQIQAEGASDNLDVDHDPKSSTTSRQTRSTPKFMSTIGKKKQQSLGFDGAYSSDDSDAEPNITPSKKKQTTRKVMGFVNLVSSSDENTPSTALTKTPTKKTPSGRITRSSDPKSKSRRQKSITLSSSDNDAPIPAPRSRGPRKGQAQRGTNTPTLPRLHTTGKRIVQEDSPDDDPIISSPKRSQKPTYQVKRADDDEDEDDEDIKPTPVRRRARQPFVDEEEDEPIVSPLKRNRSNFKLESSSDSDVSPTKRPRRGNQQNFQSDSDDLPSPSKIPRQSRASESDTPQRTTRQQKGKRKHRTEREKKMELLKRKRNGENIEELTDSGSNSDASEEEDDFEQLEEFDDEEDEELPVRNSAKGKQKKMAEEDVDSDNFVTDDEDEDGNIGIPGYASIPVEFTQQAHKPLKEHFKDVVEWLVHNKLNPHFPKSDDLYLIAFEKVDRECVGLAKSKFASTQWTPEFTRAVYARPILEEFSLQGEEGFDMKSGLPKCFACNHRKHQPSCALMFSGAPYDKKTLEELDQGRGSDDSDKSEEAEASSDNSDSDDDRSVNSNGEELASTSKRYPSGPVCKVNAQQTHILVHWKWNLNQWVLQSLQEEGELTPAKLAEREAMNLKKRTKYANKVVDRWEESGQIKSLWRDYKSQVDTARNLIAQGKGGWK
ncbi:uncharacterized protein PAC_06875 [Phialocephala subalpina]|uniref:DUF4211 domain-containing protein n=1 Tax=Phialocephala subalpina TaxID=576137 RepID=A0A1L7WW46_9HELO|nr:uncharacterized protein PAC_06875 [Phialocephala subalpina]